MRIVTPMNSDTYVCKAKTRFNALTSLNKADLGPLLYDLNSSHPTRAVDGDLVSL